MERKILFCILILAFLLRIIGLTNHPAGFTPDEASFGYDAFCILKTGKDQWGNFLPLDLKSFGDHKMPLYAYLTVPSVTFFGLSELAVRLPNVILGTLAVYATYLLVRKWRKSEREALMSAFLLAFSPWHVPLSRGAFEANLTTFFLPLAIYLFFRGINRAKYFVFSAVLFGLNLFSYHSARLVTPLVLLALIINFKKKIGFKSIKYLILTFLPFLILAIYTYLIGAGSRTSSAGIFSLAEQAKNNRYDAVLVGLPDWLARTFNNKLTMTWKLFERNYFEYLSPQFLFSQGPGEYTYGMVPGSGVLYLIEAIFLVYFLWFLFSNKLNNWHWFLVWILVSPVPAALAIGPGYAANRAAIMMPAIQIASGIGANLVFERIKVKKILLFFLVVFWLCLFAIFLENYFVQQRARGALSMIYGTREVMDYVNKYGNNYNKIIISKKVSEPHIFVAFYTKMDPLFYQSSTKDWNFESEGYQWVDQMPEYELGRFSFKFLDWKVDFKQANTLIVGTPDEFSENVVPIYKILYPNKIDAYWVVNSLTRVFAFLK